MRKRKHRNSARLTARERATALGIWWDDGRFKWRTDELVARIERAIQAAVRQALARYTRRLNDRLGATGDIAPLARKKAGST